MGAASRAGREHLQGSSPPDSTNLFILLTLADKLGLRGILMCPKMDMCDQAESQYVEQTAG